MERKYDPTKKNESPEAGIGIFDYYVEEPKIGNQPEAGVGLFHNYQDHQDERLPEAGIGIFDHLVDD